MTRVFGKDRQAEHSTPMWRECRTNPIRIATQAVFQT
jgi:hypothetical protein